VVNVNVIGSTGRDASVALADTDHALTKYEQAAIVAQTPIHYSDSELLQVIHQHLTERGLEQTANTLLAEAVCVNMVLMTQFTFCFRK